MYVPSSVVNDVREQSGAASVGPQRRILEGTRATSPVTPSGTAPGSSFVHGESTTDEPCSAVPVSSSVIGAGGGTTSGLSVECAFCPKESVTTYGMGVAVPVNVGTGSNVTVPFDCTVYVPCPVTVTEVFVQVGAVSPTPHSLIEAFTNGFAAAPGESLPNGDSVCVASITPIE